MRNFSNTVSIVEGSNGLSYARLTPSETDDEKSLRSRKESLLCKAPGPKANNARDVTIQWQQNAKEPRLNLLRHDFCF